MYQACTIAGSDSGGGAGIQADIKVFAAHNVFGTSVVTAITAQNTCGVNSSWNVPSAIVADQLHSILSDFDVRAVKTGMLPSVNIVKTIANILRARQVKNLVIDPVFVSSSGFQLTPQGALPAIVRQLFPIALLVTPNIPESETLAGMKIATENDVHLAGEKIIDMGCRNVLIKGGHAAFAPATDVFYDGKTFTRFAAPFINTNTTHGTGCAYSAAITANLANGANLMDAIRHAKDDITRAIEHGLHIGRGDGPVNPFPPES